MRRPVGRSTCFHSQHLGGRGMQISSFQASLVYTEKPYLEKNQQGLALSSGRTEMRWKKHFKLPRCSHRRDQRMRNRRYLRLTNCGVVHRERVCVSHPHCVGFGAGQAWLRKTSSLLQRRGTALYSWHGQQGQDKCGHN